MASMSPVASVAGMTDGSPRGDAVSPRQPAAPKNVAFELLFVDAPHCRARLPMRVQIYPHDTTDSIVTTVKNFYGLYSGPTGSKGVSFEDKEGNTLIARYENFANNMVVYVRVFEEYPAEPVAYGNGSYRGTSAGPGAQTYFAPDAYHGQPVHQSYPEMDRPASRASRHRSRSPASFRDRRDDSVGSAGQKRRSRSLKSAAPLNQADTYSDYMAGYSSDEGGAPSTTSTRTKEQLGNTDISVENIVEGGRRKRAKFESSELPLFAPPQMPAATSNPSVSPARRIDHQRPSMPFAHPGQNPFANPRPMQAAQNYSHSLQSSMYAPPGADHRRSRSSTGIVNGGAILPTPDPTVGSCVSEEDKDVALQLMRLGDMSHISHGRTSASTLDDTFSGRAEVASSTGATSDSESDSEDGVPPARRQKLDISGASRGVYGPTDTRFMPQSGAEFGSGGIVGDAHPAKSKPSHKPKTPSSAPKSKPSKNPKGPRPMSQVNGKKLPPVPVGPISPTSAPSSRKPSITSATGMLPPGEDDQPDLSTKPRCQRCRKSKKGCDRQRPCGRCRDAGLSADQCISEDEGNGRKGRYGRHMGVPIKKEEAPVAVGQPALLPAAPIAAVPPIMSADKAKKRKR